MSLLLGFILLFGITLASVPYDSTQYKSPIIEWVEKATSEVVDDIKESMQRLQNLADMAESPEVKRLTGVYYENQHFLDLCQDSQGTNLASAHACLDLTVDIANITQQFLFGYRLASDVGSEVIVLLDEVEVCQSKSIWKQIGCYNDAFKEFQNAVKLYTTGVLQFLHNATAVLKQSEEDIANCFKRSQQVSFDDLHKEIELCKLYVLN